VFIHLVSCGCSTQDIKRVESMQRRFTKRLPGMSHLKYTARQTSLGLETLELRRWHLDLVLTYKILFGKLDTDCMDMFTVRSQSIARGHQWKLSANHCRVDARKHFICERVVAVWNSLPILADNLKSIASFRTLLKSCGTNISDFLYIL